MKLLHKVVKSSQDVQYNGYVSIDNTVVVKQKPIQTISDDADDENGSKHSALEQRIQTEVLNRLAAHERELSEKEKQAFEEINVQKSKIITEALAEAEKIAKEANLQSLVMQEKARQKGFDEGFQEGKSEALKQEEKNLKAVADLLIELNNNREAIYIENENALIDLAYDLTKKITMSEIKTDREIIFSIVKQACKSFRNSDYVKISLAKCEVSEKVVTDEKLLRKIAGNIPDIDIELLQDAESGTVIIDNDKEIIDASVPTQLDLLKEIMNNSKKSIE